MAPVLPPELVTQIIRQLFTDADELKDRLVYKKLFAPFLNLRLTSFDTKASANAAWPAGLAVLANNAARDLLRDRHSAVDFQRILSQARRLFEEAESLKLFRILHAEKGGAHKLVKDQAWFTGVRHVVGSTRELRDLALELDDAIVALRDLPLSHLRLQKLHLRCLGRRSLLGLDLSQMGTLDELEVHGDGKGDSAELVGFKLPPNASSVVLAGLLLSSPAMDALHLERNGKLRRLEMSDGGITSPLPAISTLEELRLYNVQVKDHLPSLAEYSSLQDLDVSANRRITSAAPLGLGRNGTLARSNISKTGVHDAATIGLATNGALVSLVANACEFTSLAFGLPGNSSLKKLSLAECQLTATLMQQLRGELAGNRTLVSLDLSCCRLRDDVVVHLKLEKTSGLKELNLLRNSFSNAGLQPLAGSIQEHGLLFLLDLRSIPKVTQPFAAELATPERAVLWAR